MNDVFQRLIFLISVILIPILAKSQCGECAYDTGELVENGNFAQGDVGFSSDYNGNPNPGGGLPPLWNAGTYQVGNNAGDFHWDFDGLAYAPFPFFSNFMVVNGSATDGASIWCQDIPVVPGGSYDFSMWVQSVVTQNPAELQVQINGQNVGPSFNAPSNLNNWQNHSTSWIAPEGVFLATVCITNVNTTVGGNDFGLDAISFSGCSPFLIENVALAGPDTTICSGETLQLGTAPQANISYTWNDNPLLSDLNIANPEVTIENTTSDPASYTFIVSSDSSGLGCISTDTVVVNVVPQLVIDLEENIAVCDFPIIIGDDSSTGEYSWNTGNNTAEIEVTGPGLYSVTLNLDGCEASAETNVTQTDFESVDLGSDVVVCTMPVSLDAGINGADYLWNTGENTQTVVADNEGVYSVTVSENGCESTDSVNVSIDNYLSFDLGDNVNTCSLPIELETPIYDANYSWSNGENGSTSTINSPGWISLEIDQDGCSGEDSLLVNLIDFEEVDLGPDITVCELPITLSSNITGESYTWDTGDNTAETEVDQPGTYSLTVIQNGCESSDEVTVSVDSEIPIDLGPDMAVCDFPITIESPVGGVNYTWSDGTTGSEITVVEPGTVTLDVELDGCTGSDEVTISLFEPEAANLPDSLESCTSPVELSADLNNADYLWSTGSETNETEVTASGWVVLEYSQNNCPAADSTYVLIDPLFEFSMEPEVNVCSFPYTFDSEVSAQNYNWSDGSSNAEITVQEPGTYTLAAEEDGCIGEQSVEINQIAYQQAQLPDSIAVCELPLNLFSGVSSGDSYQWSTGAQTEFIDVIAAGTYAVSVVDNGCPSTAQTVVSIQPLPEISISGQSQTICADEKVQIAAQVDYADEISWNHGSSELSVLLDEAGVYTLVAENFCGSVSESVDIIVEDCSFRLFIPNAFSPNADGVNDLFWPQAINFTDTEFQVYARNGQLVFETFDMENEKWNGNVNGSSFYSQSTVFVYQFKGRTLQGRIIEKSGTITVVR